MNEGVRASESSGLSSRTVRTDEQLLAIDIAAALVDGRQTAEAAVAAAIRADRIGVQPRSLTFLAEVQPISSDGAPGDRELREWRQEVERYGGGVFVTTGEPPELPPGTIVRVA